MGYLGSQAVRAATKFADSRQELFAPAHLLLAVLDQADAEVVERLNGAGIDPARPRLWRLRCWGHPRTLPWSPCRRCARPAHTTARPCRSTSLTRRHGACCVGARATYPLAVSSARATGTRSSSLEHRAAWRTADRRGLDDDQRYSLLSHHHDRVEALAHEARPDLVETRQQLKQRSQRSIPRLVHQQRPRAWQRIAPNFMVGWPTWFSNRHAGLRDKYFRLVTAPAYRGQPAVRPPR